MVALADLLKIEMEAEAWRMYMAEALHCMIPKRIQFPRWRDLVSPEKGCAKAENCDSSAILDDILTKALGG